MKEIPFNVEKIVCPVIDKHNNIEDYIEAFLSFKSLPKTFRIVNNNKVNHCPEGKWRSFSDIVSLVLTKFPDADWREAVYHIFQQFKQQEDLFTIFCDDVKKVVIAHSDGWETMYEEGANKRIVRNNHGYHNKETIGVDNMSFEDWLEVYNDYVADPSKPQPKRLLIGVYGSLKKGYHNHVLIKDQEFIGDYHLNIPYRMISLGGFPGLVKSNESNTIYFEIYSVTPEAYSDVERLEGYPNFYDKFIIKHPETNEDVEIYVLNEKNDNYKNYPSLNRKSW